MALVFCPECGEETLDQLNNCPLCDEPLVKGLQGHTNRNRRLYFLGLAFLGGLVSATLCNMLGFTALAMGLATLGVLFLAAFIVKLNVTS